MPPQHGKTELVLRRLAPKILGDNPDTRIIACSYGSSLAADSNRDVQLVMDDEPYRRLYPGTRLAGKNVRAEHGQLPPRNTEVFGIVGRRGFYKSAGVGGPITGKPMDVGIIDDPFKNREEADSPVVRESIWKWYTSAFLSRTHKRTRQLICHTRWHPEDLVGRLLKQQAEDPKAARWHVLVLPAICEVAGDGVGSPRRPGDPLWPEVHPLELLQQKKAANPYDWDSLYQQRPRNPGSTEWPDNYFDQPGFWFDEWPPLDQLVVRTIALDPSKGAEAKTSDWQAIAVFGRDKRGNEYVELDMARRPVQAARGPDGSALGEGMVEELVDRCVWFRPHAVGVESNQFQFLLKVPIEQEMRRRKIEGVISPILNQDPKPLRIRRLGVPLSQRRLRFRNTPGTREAVEQMKQFPNASHDDGPDAVEMARRLAIDLYNEAFEE